MTSAFDRQLSNPRPARWLVLVLGLLITVVVHVPTMVQVDLKIGGGFYDSDAYMRMQRVIELQHRGEWFDARTPRTNAPIGETLHWTRPLDAMLLAGAWVGSAVTGFKDALTVWGWVFSPVLLLLLTAVWYRGTAGLLSDTGFLLSLVVVPLLPLFDLAFVVGRPDHHSLLNLLFVSTLVLLFRLVTGRDGARTAFAAGAVSGMAMWVSVEAIVATTYFAAVLALLWVWRGKPAYLNQTVVFFAGLLASLSVALIVERPPSQWTAPLYDSISVVHWALAAAAAGAWVMIAAVARRFGTGQDYRLRLAGALAGALIPALVMAVVFPRFFLGPFADYSWPYLQQWLYTIEEYGPLLALSPERIVLLADELGPVLIAVGYTIYRLRRGGRTERQLMALLLLGFAGFIGLALDSVRWIVYAQALAWLPWTLAALTIFDRNPKLAIFRRRIPVRAPLIGLFLTVPALVALALTPRAPVAQAASLPHCDWPRMAAYLADRHGRENGSEQLLLTGIFIGPSLVWSTPYNVVGAPYGNARSLTDTFGFFGAVDDRAPREIVTRRDVDLVLVCRSSDERQYYSKPGGRDLFDRLAADMPPPWLEPVRLPDALAGAFRLYSVARSSRSPDAVAR